MKEGEERRIKKGKKKKGKKKAKEQISTLNREKVYLTKELEEVKASREGTSRGQPTKPTAAQPSRASVQPTQKRRREDTLEESKKARTATVEEIVVKPVPIEAATRADDNFDDNDNVSMEPVLYVSTSPLKSALYADD